MFRRKTRVLFVCTENLCRSPLAEGVFRHHIQSIGGVPLHVSSSGTRTSRPGARPDARAIQVATEAGVNLGGIRASKVTQKELVRSDFVFAMDSGHVKELLEICPQEHHGKIQLLLNYAPAGARDDVPDPYYGSYQGFVEVFRMIDEAVQGMKAQFEASED